MKSNNWFVSLYQVLTTPSCWRQLNPYSPEWDAELNRLMKIERFKETKSYHTVIGPYKLWVGNYPYCSFILGQLSDGVRPSRSTVLRAGRKLVVDRIAAATTSAND